MHKQAIKHKQAIIGGGYLFTENACYILYLLTSLIMFGGYVLYKLFIETIWVLFTWEGI